MTRRELPSGTLTFLFTDVEGSTRLAEQLGPGFAPVLERHRTLLRAAFARHQGVEVATEGDSFFVAFERASEAVAAAVEGQRSLAAEPWPGGAPVRVRMGLHTGEAVVADGTYLGHDVNRAARIAAAGHGGQVLVSEATAPLASPALPSGTRLRSLGEHRLKDLRPERICQLDVDGLPSDFPPIHSLDLRANNLPTQLTSFVGREAEVAAVAELLRTARLVTLTGPGGTGKTRLSLQVAAEIADRFPDGVTWVPLAEIADADLVPSQIATALGVQDAGGRPHGDRLSEHLRERELLLVLDNFEQVVAAAPLLADLLRDARRVRLLVSSRIVLRIGGEHEFPVPPLGLPATGTSPADPAASDAVRLFAERAAAARPGFTVDASNAAAVATVVARLDGLPLAIELAAARIRLLTPDAMLNRLERLLDMLSSGGRDVPARQRTLRGAIAWSHDLLDPPLRRLFARFSVFVGGAGLDEAEAVCGPATDLGIDVLDGLEQLVEHSLIRRVEDGGEPRFAMLATIQEFAAEQLVAGDEAGTSGHRHAATFTALAERAAPHLTAEGGPSWLDRLALEHDNMRAALTWSAGGGESTLGLRLVAALWRFWQIRGHLAEGRARAERALAQAGDGTPPDLLAAAHEAAGGLAYWLGDFAAATAHYEAEVAAAREHGDPATMAQALYNLAFPLVFGTTDTAWATETAHEAERLFREVGDRAGLARTLWLMANLAVDRGDTARARAYCLEALPTLRELGETFMLGWCLFTLGEIAIHDGDVANAGHRLSEALAQFEAAGDVSGIVLVLDAVATLAHRVGDLVTAARLSGAVARLEAISGTALNPTNRQIFGFDPLPLRDDPATAGAWRAGHDDSTDAILAAAREWTAERARTPA